MERQNQREVGGESWTTADRQADRSEAGSRRVASPEWPGHASGQGTGVKFTLQGHLREKGETTVFW